MGDTQTKQINKPFIIIDNKWFGHKENGKWVEGWISKYTAWGLSIYCLLQKNMTLRQQIPFSLEYIYECFNIAPNNKQYRDEIKNIIGMMCEDGIFALNKNINNLRYGDFIIGKISLPEYNYTKIYDFQMDKIFNYKGKANKQKLFVLFSFIKRSINSDSQYCFPSEKDIIKASLVKSNNTVENGKKILKDLGLIIYGNPGYRVFSDGSIKQSNDIYVVAESDNAQEILDNAIETYKLEMEENKIKISEGKLANKKRSKTMKEYHKRKREETKGDMLL